MGVCPGEESQRSRPLFSEPRMTGLLWEAFEFGNLLCGFNDSSRGGLLTYVTSLKLNYRPRLVVGPRFSIARSDGLAEEMRWLSSSRRGTLLVVGLTGTCRNHG